MKKKFLISLILVFVLVTLVLTGCSKKPDETVENNIQNEETVDGSFAGEEALEHEGFIEENPDLISGAIKNEDKFVVGVKQENPVYYSQIDYRWKNHPYSAIGDSSQTIGSSGCGPTSAAMVVSTIKGTIYPDQMGDLYLKYGYRSPRDGTYFSAFQWTANYFDIGFKRVWNVDAAIQAVRDNYYVVASCGPGLFTTGGHFIVIYGIDGDTLKIYDPYMYNGKFNYRNRGGKVSVEGNTVYCSVYNFKAYANSGAWFCFKSEGQQVDPTPEPTPTPSTDTKTGIVKVNSGYTLNVRRGPGTNYPYVRSLNNGTTVTIYKTENGWYNIGTGEWVSANYIIINSGSSTVSRNTVGQTRKLAKDCHLYANPDLTGYEYDYLANTKVIIKENTSERVDKIYVPATGRTAYIDISNYSNTTTSRNTVGQTRYFKTTYTYIYSNKNLSGIVYYYLANTKVIIKENTSAYVDYIYVPATGRYGYVSTSVYR